jgi:hypothetical protein
MDFKNFSNTKLVIITVTILFGVYIFWDVFAIIGILYIMSLVNGDKFNQFRGKIITPEIASKLSKVFGNTNPSDTPSCSSSEFTGEMSPYRSTTPPIPVF